MKLLIASDIHGSALYCRHLLDAADREQPDRILLLGDLLYHGPRNDLPDGYAPKEVISLLNDRRAQLFCVRGNCEAEVDQMVLTFPVLADYCLVELDGHLVFATHGHHASEAAPPPLQPGDVLLCGHTHIPACRACGELVYLNPGSVSIPKAGSRRSYLLYDGGVFSWKDLSGKTYHTWSWGEPSQW